MPDASITPTIGKSGIGSKSMKKVTYHFMEECRQERSSVNDSALFDILRELEKKEDISDISGITTSKAEKHGKW